MPLDPAVVDEAREWLAKASIDLRAAAIDLGATPPLIEDALFHCQQAVEKSFKAFLTLHAQPFRRTHQLEEIGESCLRIDPSLKTIVDRVVPLSEYAWAYRYPGPYAEVTRNDAAEALASAQEAYAAVLDRLPIQARPEASSLEKTTE